MNAQIKAAWIAALRSGEYKQGQGRLRFGDEFCCLGVLCDLAFKQGLGKWEGFAFKSNGFHLVATVLPPPIADWAGLEQIDPTINKQGISIYNDGSASDNIDPRPFSEIAALIEKYL